MPSSLSSYWHWVVVLDSCDFANLIRPFFFLVIRWSNPNANINRLKKAHLHAHFCSVFVPFLRLNIIVSSSVRLKWSCDTRLAHVAMTVFIRANNHCSYWHSSNILMNLMIVRLIDRSFWSDCTPRILPINDRSELCLQSFQQILSISEWNR